jgi:hypothetical protein
MIKLDVFGPFAAACVDWATPEAILVRPAAILLFSRLAGISLSSFQMKYQKSCTHLERGIRTRKDSSYRYRHSEFDSGKIGPARFSVSPFGLSGPLLVPAADDHW